MTEYDIDKDVPVPKGRKSSGWDFIKEMKSGESFFVETEGEQGNWSKINGLRNRARYLKIKITVRKEKTGFRVWKLEG